MCGRFALTATPDQTATFLGLGELEAFPARYNIAPTQPILLAIASEPRAPGSNLPDRQAMLVRWGFIPAWVKDTKSFPLLINARTEGAAEKASFRAAMRHRRALVPASGFYEWRKTSGGKGQPYWIRPKRGGLVAFGALMETYAEPGGSEMDTGALLTTSASADIAHIHLRMPVVIEPEHFSRWLDCRTLEPRDVADLLRPADEGFFEAVPVADLVNRVANTGPELQERFVAVDIPEPDRPRRRKQDDSQMTLF
jgi:putative SOS response-associated peptidase YedK